MKNIVKILVAAAFVCCCSNLALAQTVLVSCSSEDEGDLLKKIPPSAFEYDAENALASVNNYLVGTMRNGEIEVRVNIELYGQGRSVQYQNLELRFIPVDGSPLVGARMGGWQRSSNGVGLVAIGPGVDPEGLGCTFKAKMPKVQY